MIGIHAAVLKLLASRKQNARYRHFHAVGNDRILSELLRKEARLVHSARSLVTQDDGPA